ncbi:hypothetical protein BDF20DRAFT_193794 [Mycotypha africana]|uniref:uncharacterized protein n=1 Tax=Mycotypha africana TaxID=64632 RepID=UPI0022FFD11C|nr:uncharacterized protein BDF20DRAFT_193794 [Mycotypha africana]KAI8967886.1 hypothetical protein BDF20DRAFT_193794 [Mycotypha africana]
MHRTESSCRQSIPIEQFLTPPEHNVNHDFSFSSISFTSSNCHSTLARDSADHPIRSPYFAFSRTIVNNPQASKHCTQSLSDQYFTTTITNKQDKKVNNEKVDHEGDYDHEDDDQEEDDNEKDDDEDYEGEEDDDDEDELNAPSYETILFYEILKEFPDLASFIRHEDFNTFSQIWLELQRQKDLARYPANRSAVQAWLKYTALQIHAKLVTLVKNNPGNKDQNSEARRMFSAWRRLKDRVEVTHQIFQIIEDRRILYNQTPKQAVVDLRQAAAQLNRGGLRDVSKIYL